MTLSSSDRCLHGLVPHFRDGMGMKAGGFNFIRQVAGGGGRAGGGVRGVGIGHDGCLNREMLGGWIKTGYPARRLCAMMSVHVGSC